MYITYKWKKTVAKPLGFCKGYIYFVISALLQYIIIQYIIILNVLCWTDHVEYLGVLGVFIYLFIDGIYLFILLKEKCILCSKSPWKRNRMLSLILTMRFRSMCRWSLSLFILCFLCCGQCTLLSRKPVELLIFVELVTCNITCCAASE